MMWKIKSKPERAAVLAVVLLFVFSVMLCYSKEYGVNAYGYTMDLPDGWVVVDAEQNELISFADPEGKAIFQIRSYPGETFQSPDEIFRRIKEGLKADGEGAPFSYNGRDSILADLSFQAGDVPVRGYFVFMEGKKTDIALMSFSAVSAYNETHDFLLSCIDSFAPDGFARQTPGPISQFYAPLDPNNPGKFSSRILGRQIDLFIDPMSIEASQVLIEREARILIHYKNDRDEAWRRFYRMIYRDSFGRLRPIFTALEAGVESRAVTRQELPKRLLEWVQSYSYSRTQSMADILAPLASAVHRTGDCDSRGLLYAAALEHFGIDAVLLVSSEYKHSLVGVDMAGGGARFPFDGKKYLIAETTDQVDIGLVPQSMADPAGWVGVQIGTTE